MEIRPDGRLLTKHWLTLLTFSLCAILFAAIMTAVIPLADEDVHPRDFAGPLWGIVLGLIVLLWIIGAPIIVLWVKNLSFEVGDDKVTIHKGILSKIEQNIPLRMITDFRLHRSLYDRWLGIGTVEIQTAGQSQSATGYEGKLVGLADWEMIHHDLRRRLEMVHPTAGPSGAGAPDAVSGQDRTLELILEELRAIRRNLKQ